MKSGSRSSSISEESPARERVAASLLQVRGLVVSYTTPSGGLRALDGIDLALARGETVSLLGESGSGKSTLARAVSGLLPGSAVMEGGSVLFDGEDLASLPAALMRRLRGRRIGMVFQDPAACLDPCWRVRDPVEEALRAAGGMGRARARTRARQLLESVGLGPADAVGRLFPHELSGGMKQRVLIAAAVACGPDLLVADEPTSALDVTVRAQILALLRRLRDEGGMALLLVTHDLRVAACVGGRVVVLYAGRCMEEGDVAEVLARPAHPYTKGLLASVPGTTAAVGGGRLPAIPGAPPDMRALPAGCAFRPRCTEAMERCGVEAPGLIEIGPGRRVACHCVEGAGA